ncbi:MAG: squalene cyclase [Acidimicrobiia bacterium]|nr:squalene cyclase [Acidimicrobiia bacterium]
MSRADVVDWLLDPEDSDPSIRWQTMRDLVGSPQSQWEAERARIETEGWGARLLGLEDNDGQWAGGAHFPSDFVWGGSESGQPWTATSHVLSQLRDFGLPWESESARRAVDRIGKNCRWEHDNQPYWEGEVEPCINGITVANGTYFGVDLSPVVDRLLAERMPDGGWNCEAENGSTRTSFDTTINVLQGLLEVERVGRATTESTEARLSGEDYLLKRSLFIRLSTGEPADDDFLELRNPVRWQYDILRALDYFRDVSSVTGVRPDPRMDHAAEHVLGKRREDGMWALDKSPPGRVWFDVDDGPGLPSRWITLRALRSLEWVGALPTP